MLRFKWNRGPARTVLALAALVGAGCGTKPSETPPAAVAPPREPGPWPQWRGPTGMGLASEPDLPAVWSAESSNVRWRTDIRGTGNSSPIVDGGRVYLTTAYEDEEGGSGAHRACLAVDFETGEILWEKVVVTMPAETRHSMNTSAAPTPVTDGEQIFVYFGSHLAALDLDGRIVWNREIDPEYLEYSHYAAASSPILIDGLVIVAQDQERGDTDELGWLAAFDKATGERLWRQEWDDTCCSYATPLVMRQGGVARLLFAHSGRVVEYDPLTGEKLWSHSFEINQMVSSLVAEGDVLCIAGGAHNVRLSTCVRLEGHRENTRVEVLWESLKGPPETSSPVLYDGKLYTVTSKGFLSCFDARSGENLWRKRLVKRGGYHVSLLAGDSKIYVPNARGAVTVIDAASPKGRVISENQLDGGSNASPAVAYGSLLFRTWDQLVRIDKEAPAASGPATAAES